MGLRLLRNGARTIVCLVGVLAGMSVAEAATLKVGGTGAALGGMKLLATAYAQDHPDVQIEVLPSLGSGGGIKALLAGAIDIAVSARPLKDKERAAGAVDRAYARSPLVLATRNDNATDSVSVAELEGMYSGHLAEWPDGRTVRLIVRPPSETDIKLLRSLSPGMAEAVDMAIERPGLVSATDDQENAAMLEELPGSLGAISLGQVLSENRDLKLLSVDGVVPSVALAAD
ncbi:MAG: substrate-binding domain-containing protein, partial [Pseudomonadota bacterium]